MDNNSKKRKRLKRLYEFDNYDSDDKMTNEPLLDDNNRENIFINNDSIQTKPIINKLKKNKKINKKSNNKKNNNVIIERKTENKAFNYIVQIDFDKRKYLSDKTRYKKMSKSIPSNAISTSKYTFIMFYQKYYLNNSQK